MDLINSESVSVPWGEELFPGGSGGGDTYRGAWRSGTTYQAGDLVYWNQSLYRATATTSVLTPVPVGSPTTAQTGDTTIAIPAGAVPGDLMLISIAWPQAFTPLLFPDLFTLIGQGASVIGTGTSVANTISWHQLDSGDIAAGSFALQPTGDVFVAWGSLFRNAMVLDDLAGAPYYTNASTAFFFESIISALTGVGAVTTTASGDPQEAHGLEVAGVNASFIAAIGWSVSNPDPTEALFFVTDDGAANPSLKNTLAEIAILPLSSPKSVGQPWTLYADMIPLGNSMNAPGAIVIGDSSGATAAAQDAVVIGGSANADGYRGVALGYSSEADGQYGTALGTNSAATDLRSIAVGAGALTYASEGIAIGGGANVNSPAIGGIAIGANSYTAAVESVVVGYNSQAGENSVTVGSYAHQNPGGGLNTAIGNRALMVNTGVANTAVGQSALNANTDGDDNTAVGLRALIDNVHGNYNVGIGVDASPAVGTDPDRSISIGNAAKANANDSIVIGTSAYADSVDSVVLGSGASDDSSAWPGGGGLNVVIGKDTTATGYKNVVIGSATGGGLRSISIGDSGGARSHRGIVLGYGAIVGGGLPSATPLTDAQDGIAIGTDAYAGDQNTVAIGNGAFANHTGNGDAIAIGHNASLSSSPLGVAIGANTSVSALAGVAIGQASTVTGSYGVAIGGGTAADSSVAIGTHNTSAQATGLNSIAVGGDAQALALGSAAFGIGATAQGTYGLSIGYTAAGTGGNAIAIGKLAQGGGVNSLAIGLSASASADGSVAIGTDSSGAGAAATATNEVSLGTANHQVRVRGTLRVDRAKQSTVGAAGGASALPATPSAYVPIVASDGTEYVLPVYAKV